MINRKKEIQNFHNFKYQELIKKILKKIKDSKLKEFKILKFKRKSFKQIFDL